MRWIKFPDGSSYTFAVDIQKFAERNGYKVPRDPNGNSHPGTDCNQKMRTVAKDAGMRRTFSITEQSVVEVKIEETPFNGAFLKWLVDNGILSYAYSRHKTVQLYTEQAVNALLSVMLKTHVEYEQDGSDEYWECPIWVTKRSHNLEMLKNKPKASLFNK